MTVVQDMRINRMAVTLSDSEIERVLRIVEGNDGEDALRFVRDVLEEKVKANELPHCVPFYDVGFHPGQANDVRRDG